MCVYYMINYIITQYSYDEAKKVNLTIKVSKNPLNKIDVYEDDIFLASIGDSFYQDYPHYIITYNIEYANKRIILYINRHKKIVM